MTISFSYGQTLPLPIPATLVFVAPAPTLAELYANVSTNNRLLLPIPQHEIDTNTQLVIEQNPGY